MQNILKTEAPSVALVPMSVQRDAAELFEAAKPVRETLQWVGQRPKEDTYSAFLNWLEWHEQDPGRVCWIVRSVADAAVVGEAYLLNMDTTPEGGLWIGPRSEDTQALHDVFNFLFKEAFDTYKFHRLQLTHSVNDIRMRRVVEGFGMTVEGVLREAFDNGDGTWSDLAVTSLLWKQWLAMAHSEGRELTVEEGFARMARNFSADRAAGVTAVIQWEIDGEGGGIWNAVIDGGACTITRGPARDPNVILQASASDWLKIVRQTHSPYELYLSRKMTVQGDMKLATRLRSFFSAQ